ncbi:hypothetical protein P153DRAFT_185452 [Dothidotthia symphoricarpi CBS 119687]|uniref:Uncharacterized protein n=1 Tax=Dothidotthia symphoricarpi CBS 119687 TaxID=1392245 RepID=A0A6A6AKS6_9PLEO|nr:uncharacterized protein P153DRAFT_185452 [Dothidotthia symphoricarpi CBS 119687]KAF2132166.1 hypothetical protein P153DRAFT_185452 [Dothidotthia symphoricarpi CBS 119687]
MATNAPYYQMRAGQFITAPNSTNAAPQQFVPQDADYDLPVAAVMESHEHHHPSFYEEHPVRHASADTPGNTLEENHNLAELLEAATTAAGQATQVMNTDVAVAVLQGASKRKRGSSFPPNDAAGLNTQGCEVLSAKRRRVDVHIDAQEDDANDNDNEDRVRGHSETVNVPPCGESPLDDARAAGVHSAAALFRRSAEKTSRKYTRPPMSKLFMSLQLSPENFLQLQAHAKTYMLDSTHPERQNCVGNRGKGDTDMVKLRLFNCVRDFLDDGVGDQFFGEHVEKQGEAEAFEAARALGEEKMPSVGEKLLWPRDGNKIISLVTPLMRRMVTNERQRMYAIETRKGGAKKKDTEGSVDTTTQHDSVSNGLGSAVDQTSQPVFDSSLAQAQPQLSQPESPLTAISVTSGQLAYTQPPTTPRKSSNAAERICRTTSVPTQIFDYGPELNLPLPRNDPAEPCLNRINIFLTLASNGTKQGVRLLEKRIFTAQPDHLMFTPWNILIHESIVLVKKATMMYPELRWKRVSPTDHTQHHVVSDENLRGLAVAANALQTEQADPDVGLVSDVHSPCLGAGANPSDRQYLDDSKRETSSHGRLPLLDFDAIRSAALDSDVAEMWFPRFGVKTLGPEGWRAIANAGDWHRVLLEHAFAYWADGTCNVIVELEDIPVQGVGSRGEKERGIVEPVDDLSSGI